MKRVCIATILAAVVATAITGCSDDQSESASSSLETTTHSTTIATTTVYTAPTPTGSGDPLYDRYAETLTSAGVEFRPGAGDYSGTYSSDRYTCEAIRKGTTDAFNLAWVERVGYPEDNNGRRVTLMVPILCPDLQPVIDEAKSGNPRLTKFTNGKFFVAEKRELNSAQVVQPGTYTVGPVSDCYWERSDSEGNIIDNNMVSIAQSITVTIDPSDGGFTSQRCGTWMRVD